MDLRPWLHVREGTTYAWDAENRLHSVTPVSGTGKKVESVYDYMSRRVEQQVWTYTGGAWPETPRLIEPYVYDGWNVVLTLNGASSNPPNAIIRKSTWGLDLSGTLQGAGGIGGLLANREGANSYWYFYDGNGNVTQVLQPSVATAGLQSALPCDWLTQILCDPAGDEASEPVVEPEGGLESGLESGLPGDGQMSPMTAGPPGAKRVTVYRPTIHCQLGGGHDKLKVPWMATRLR
jgi:hypothetical protein